MQESKKQQVKEMSDAELRNVRGGAINATSAASYLQSTVGSSLTLSQLNNINFVMCW